MAVDGTSEPLTVDSAVPVLEGLLSAEPEYGEDSEPQPSKPRQAKPTEPVEADEGESEEGEESEEEAAPQPTFRVKVDGQEVEVTQEELLNGYSRTSDYTRKTQALADERKAFATEAQQTREQRMQLANQLQQVEQWFKSRQPAEPQWKDYNGDADAFAQDRMTWLENERQVAALQKKREETEAQIREDVQRQHNEYLSEQRDRLVAAIPEWTNADKAKAEKGDLVSFAKGLGFTEQEVGMVTDHRVIVMLRKAMLYDKAQKAKPKVQQQIEAVKVTKPGPTAAARPSTNKTAQARQRLAKSGSVDDATALFEHLLPD